MGHQRRIRRKLFRFGTVCLSVALALLMLEAAVRIHHLLRKRHKPPVSEMDDRLGWRAVPDAGMTWVPPAGDYERVTFTTDAWGFRRSGDPGSLNTKLLVLGDSTTHAYHVSDGNAYYDVVAAERPELEVWAYGVGGYSTLQELLIMEQHWRRIEPDLVLWQLSFNDFIGNDFELERASRENNNHMRRPYLEEGRIVYRHPDGALAGLTQRSHLARRLKILFDGVAKRTAGSIETELSLNHPALQRSIATTRRLMERAVEVADGRPILVIGATPLTHHELAEAAFDQVCAVPGLHCVTGLNEALRESNQAGTPVDGSPHDSHWNATGHALAGRAILDFLEVGGYMETSSREPLPPSTPDL